MKSITLICKCGKEIKIFGKDVKEIMEKIDDSGWTDMPRPEKDICQECLEKEDANGFTESELK